MRKGIEVVLAEAAERKEKLAEWCVGLGAKGLTLEIGSGHGDFLVAYGKAHEEEVCVGLDLINKRLEKCRKKAEREGLVNTHFLKAEGEEFIEALPDGVELAKVYILFPDPWPKKKHFKNRLIQDAFLSKLASRVKGGGKLYFRTDHEEYFEWAKEFLEGHKDWGMDGGHKWDFEVKTVFQELTGGVFQSLVAERL